MHLRLHCFILKPKRDMLSPPTTSHHSHSHCHPSLRHVLAALPRRTTISTTFIHLYTHHHHHHHHPYNSLIAFSLSSPNPPPTDTQNPNPKTKQRQQILRTHNSKSSSLLLNNLSLSSHNKKIPDDDVLLSEEDKATILELSLVRKRPPLFPGSIYARPPHGNDPSVPPLSTLLEGDDDGGGGGEVLMRAIEIRRKVTFEIFVDAMTKKGKFGITYSTNLGYKLSDFIDLVMIEAAAMKNMPEFSRLSFNARARKFIEESNVVPLIRWLKHHSLSYPQIGRMVCMSKGDLESIRSLVLWLNSIHVKGRYIGVVFMRVGETILRRNMEELDEVILYLESEGVRRDWMGYVISRCSELLAFSLEEVKTRVSFYTDMGMNKHDFGTMVYDCPKVLGYFSLEDMKQKKVISSSWF